MDVLQLGEPTGSSRSSVPHTAPGPCRVSERADCAADVRLGHPRIDSTRRAGGIGQVRLVSALLLWLRQMSRLAAAVECCTRSGAVWRRRSRHLPREQKSAGLRRSPSKTLRQANATERRRGEAYIASVIAGLEAAPSGGRNAALNGAGWTLGHWVAAGALEQFVVEDALYAAAERNGLVATMASARPGRLFAVGFQQGSRHRSS